MTLINDIVAIPDDFTVVLDDYPRRKVSVQFTGMLTIIMIL